MAAGSVVGLLFFAELIDDVFYDPLEGDTEVAWGLTVSAAYEWIAPTGRRFPSTRAPD